MRRSRRHPTRPAVHQPSERAARHFHGVAVTYAQVAVKASVHQRLTMDARTLVILDEVHHGGDALSWGDALREAYGRATRRLLLSGTPFRSDTAPIPFVEYHPNEKGIRLSRTDYNYGYGRALADGVVRPVLFLVYAGKMRWRTKAGDELEAHLGQDNTKDVTAQAWRTALDPEGDWIPAVLRSADRRLSEVRQDVPDAGGLVIATDQTAARVRRDPARDHRRGADRRALRRQGRVGADRDVRHGDDPLDGRRAHGVGRRRRSSPRVGVYATSASTPLFFAQAIGRFVRARRRGESASVFLPNVPVLLTLAGEMERERDHALDREGGDDDGLEDTLLAEAEREDKASDDLEQEFSYQALGSVAHFDRVLYDGKEFGQLAVPGTPEEEEFLGLPGLLEPEHVHELLMQRQSRQSRHRRPRGEGGNGRSPRHRMPTATLPPALHRTLREQRQLLNSLVGLCAPERRAARSRARELRRICGDRRSRERRWHSCRRGSRCCARACS
jgi:hypothetical protein